MKAYILTKTMMEKSKKKYLKLFLCKLELWAVAVSTWEIKHYMGVYVCINKVVSCLTTTAESGLE